MRQEVEFGSWFKIATSVGINFDRLNTQLASGVQRLLSNPRYRSDSHVWMTGSGDSLFAAQIVLPALERWTGLTGTVVSSMEFSRYRVPLLTSQDTLLAISNSGSAARTREAVSLAREKGVFTIGITGSETGPLALLADAFLFRPVEDLPQIPVRSRGIFMNMNEFLVTLYSLYFTGLHLGLAHGTIVQAEVNRILSMCETAILSVGHIASLIEVSVAELATELTGLNTIWTIGAGPSFGTARYCAAKFHEQLPWNGIPEDLEEWAHLQYFLALAWKDRSAVFVLAPPGNALDRAQELVEGIAGVGGRALVITNHDVGRFPGAVREFRLPGSTDEFLAAFTYHIPPQMLILYLSVLAGVEPYALPRADGYKLIRHGIVLEHTDLLT